MTLSELVNNEFAFAIGWTLLHSLWQSLVIAMVVAALLRWTGMYRARLRYAFACAGLLATFVASLVTLVFTVGETAVGNAALHSRGEITIAANSISLESAETTIIGFVNQSMDVFLAFWLTGAVFFSLRLIGGCYYLNRLRSTACYDHDHLTVLLERLKDRLKIPTVVRVAESAMAQTPLVIGYLRPVILFPIGMASWLSTAELEAILLHELAHIRRHDYLINLLQSILEVVFFFNPFVWLMSGWIRKEREYCCDDLVVANEGDAMAYAHALARIESSRIQAAPLALSLLGQKNYLLTRIKRLMEKSLKTRNGLERIIPFALLVTGFICASWLTLQGSSGIDKTTMADTTIRPVQSQSYVFTEESISKDGKPVKRYQHIYEGDAPTVYMPAPPTSVIPGFEPFTPVEAIPAFPGMPVMGLTFYNDSVPLKRYAGRTNWAAISREFEEIFKARFGEFYEKNHKDLEKVFEELEIRLEHDLDNEEWVQLDHQALSADLEHLQEQLEHLNFDQLAQLDHLDNLETPDVGDLHLPDVDQLREQAWAMKQAAQLDQLRSEEWSRWSEDMSNWSADMQHWQRDQEASMRAMEQDMRGLEENMKAFEKVLLENLIADGYLKKSDEVKTIDWRDDGIRVNGVDIRKEHLRKYDELHRKHFKRHPGNVRIPE